MGASISIHDLCASGEQQIMGTRKNSNDVNDLIITNETKVTNKIK